MELTNLKEKYNSLLKDQDFDRLDLGLKNPNIFQILGISNAEIRHSNFLSWLLDPNQSHGLGDVFLKRFLREVFSSDKFEEINQVDVEGLDLTKAQIKREQHKIDILIELEKITVCIENKVWSPEHSDQLTRYKETVERCYPHTNHIFVYLTPYGTESENYFYEPVSYGFIGESLDGILEVYGESLNPQVKNYIKDYITILGEIMGTDELTELSNKIYRNHKKLFDFITEKKFDEVGRLKEIIMSALTEKGLIVHSCSHDKYHVRFLTNEIKPLIYISKDKKHGWKKGESFLFEIEFKPPSNKIQFKTVILVSTDKYDFKRLEKMLLEINEFKEAQGQKWLVNKIENGEFTLEAIPSMSDDEIKESVNSFYNKIAPIVEQVEEKLLEHEEELLNMQKV